MKTKQAIARWEYTDTFAGEANYTWVRRGEIALPDDVTDFQLARLVKKDAGLTGVRIVRQSFGDSLEFRPVGMNTVLFIDVVSE